MTLKHLFFSANILILLLLHALSASAAPLQVEIFYLAHRPAEEVVTKIDVIMASFSSLKTKKYIFGDPEVKKLLKKYQLEGHMPVAVFINGKNRFSVNGKTIVFRNFPRGDAFVPMFKGEWSYEDLRNVLSDLARTSQ